MTGRHSSRGASRHLFGRLAAATRAEARRSFRALAGIDERTLLAVRTGLAALVLWDLALRLPDLVAHYSDSGVLPRALLVSGTTPPTEVFPLYFLSGSPLWSALLLALTAAAAVLLLLGWRTRWVAALTWYLVACLHARSPLMSHGGDELLRTLLLWAILLPLGTAVSLDDRRRPSPRPRQVVTLATIGLQIHLTVLFVAESLSTLDSTAAIGALHLDHLATSWGLRLREIELLMRYAGLTIGGLGLVGPLLLWLPRWTAPIRFFVVLTFWQLHLLLIAPALNLGLQPWVAALAWLVFLPGWFWSLFTEGRLHAGPGTGASPRNLGGVVEVMVAALVLVLAAIQLAPASSKVLGGQAREAAASTARAIALDRPTMLILPDPDEIDGWFLMRGRLADGSDWDLWNDAPAELTEQLVRSRTFRNSRWTSYLAQLVEVDAAEIRTSFIAYLCRTWNGSNVESRRAVAVEIVFMLERYDRASGESRHLPVALAAGECGSPGA